MNLLETFNVSFQKIYILENNQLLKNNKEEDAGGGRGRGKLGKSVSCPTFFFRGKQREKERELYWLMRQCERKLQGDRIQKR